MSDFGITIADIAKEFKEEAVELLDEMEKALVSIQEQGMDSELINAVFRAAHTIKGTAGMYKIEYLVDFTHAAESLFDLVRNEKIKLDDNIIYLMYASKDQMLNLVEYTVTTLNEKPLSEHLSLESKRLIEELEKSMGKKTTTQENSAQAKIQDKKDRALKLWSIKIECKHELFERGMDPHSFIIYLKKIGSILDIKLLTDYIPKFEQLAPTECYLSYEITLQTNLGKQEIIDIFDFIQEDAKIDISEISLEQKKDSDNLTHTIKQETKDKKSVKEAHNPNSGTVSSLRVDAEKIDHLINLIGEMVISNANVVQKAADLKNADLIESVSIVSRMLEDIRESAMQIRMVQIGETFNRFKRIVLDLAKKLGKQVELSIQGGETELDKIVIEKITDPLVHIIRNAIDHGLEMPDDRIKAGKDPKGLISLNSYHDAGTVVIEITDNGKGLNENAIIAKAIERGILEEGAQLTQKEIFNLIFEPGFSTVAQVTDLSGRGVGMDVVKRNIEALRGNIEIKSTYGKGASFVIRLPLTLAIIDGFLVLVGNTFYVIPLDMVVECLELNTEYKAEMHGNNYINLRGTILPLLNVGVYFNES
ncbi:MAG: hypothetical protein RL154_135, partial [Pseudomonadota bacterium]